MSAAQAPSVGRDYHRRRARMIAYGQWNPHVPTELVRAHILALRAQGISVLRIAALAGVASSTVYMIVHRNGPTTTRRVGEAVLAVTHDPDVPLTARVPAWGTVRRVRALSALGWTAEQIAEAAGVSRGAIAVYLRGHRQWVPRGFAQAVAVAYQRLGGGAAPETRVSVQVRREAAVTGWCTPAGWDDHWLDLSPDELVAELGREVARMDETELRRSWEAEREGELSPLVVAAAGEWRRVKAEALRERRGSVGVAA